MGIGGWEIGRMGDQMLILLISLSPPSLIPSSSDPPRCVRRLAPCCQSTVIRFIVTLAIPIKHYLEGK
jgi:hypothetical protein